MEWIKLFDSEKEAFDTLELNAVRKVTVNNKAYCLARNTKGLFVTTDVCSHEGVSLSQGRCTSSGAIECPWHQFLFEPSTGECINQECRPLETYPVKIKDEGVFFGI
jgi:nitrite reductase/ring-hydroxylating ferredoxin subunit